MCTCESIRPGIAVIPSASITTSAASTCADDAVPTEVILPLSVRIESPLANGSFQLPETIWPRLTIAIFMSAHCAAACSGFVQIVGGKQLLDQRGRAIPIEGAEAVSRGDEARAGIEHFVLRMARAEF